MAKIMIADDSNSIRQVLQDIISTNNHQLIGEAKDGQEAIDVYKSVNPDILLLDLAMPVKDGLTVIKEVINYNPDAKIIVITASDDQNVTNECLNEGAKVCITKPFDFDNVAKIINSYSSNY